MNTFRDNMNRDKNNDNRIARKVVMGVLFIGVGLIWLAANVGVIPAIIKQYIISWQFLLIALGFVHMVGGRSNLWFGSVLMVIGGLFLYNKFFELPVDVSLIVGPLIFLLIGFTVIIKSRNAKQLKRAVQAHQSQGDVLDETVIFSGSKLNINSKCFKGGQITSIFGGSEIDFSHAELQEGITTIDISCVFGGAKLFIPADWDVVVKVDRILGGFSDKRHMSTDKHIDYSRQLVIKGSCIFGGGEIESVVRH